MNGYFAIFIIKGKMCMKKIIFLLLLVNIQPVYCMLAKSARIPLSMSSVNQRHPLNTHANFGKKHFIVGYKHTIPEEDSKRGIKRKRNENNDLINQERSTQAFFTSKDQIRSIVTTHIKEAQSSILIACFSLTDFEIADLLKKAHNKGIIVKVITDFTNMTEKYSKIKSLVEVKIPVYYYTSELNQNPSQKGSRYARMHHKFLIIDKKFGINGSMNLTKTGQKDNIENIVILREPDTVSDFIEEFERIRQQSIPCKMKHFH